MRFEGSRILISIVTDNAQSIEISITNYKSMQRFPNKMIWDINSYLAKHYKLYECYFSKTPSERYYIQLSRINSSKKYLCFSPLAPSYISLSDYDELEYKNEYEKYKQEVENYRQFFEYYSMEQIDELNYIAVDDIEELLNNLRQNIRKTYFVSCKDVFRQVGLYSDCLIHIDDHCYMSIKSEHRGIISYLLSLLKYYRT